MIATKNRNSATSRSESVTSIPTSQASTNTHVPITKIFLVSKDSLPSSHDILGNLADIRYEGDHQI